MNEEDLAKDFEDATWNSEQHYFDLGFVAKHALSKLAHTVGLKVILNGKCADSRVDQGVASDESLQVKVPTSSWAVTLAFYRHFFRKPIFRGRTRCYQTRDEVGDLGASVANLGSILQAAHVHTFSRWLFTPVLTILITLGSSADIEIYHRSEVPAELDVLWTREAEF